MTFRLVVSTGMFLYLLVYFGLLVAIVSLVVSNSNSSAVITSKDDDTIRDAILTFARKPTRVSLVCHPEPTTKKCQTEKLKSKNGCAHK